MPAFAVIAAAATLSLVGVRAVDAWKAVKQRPTATENNQGPATTTLVGRADLLHVVPDTIAFAVTLRQSRAVRRVLRAREARRARTRLIQIGALLAPVVEQLTKARI